VTPARFHVAAPLLLVVVGAAPWAFGAVEPLYWTAAAAACLAIALPSLVLAALRGAPADELPPAARRLAFALPCVALVGLTPIPMALRRVVSPTAAQVLVGADPSSAESWRPISLDPRSTLGAAAVAAACAVVFWIVARAARDERRARALTVWLLACGTALAVFGLVQRLVDYDWQAIYWTVKLPDVATPFGPYVNRNHFAGAMELFAGLAAGAALDAVARGRRVAAALCGAALAATLVALFATTSRGALVGVGAGAVFLVTASRRSGRARTIGWVLLAVALVAAALACFGLLDDLAARIHLVPSGREKNRFAVQWDALRVFAGNPMFGTGAGTFAAAYPPFQTVADARFFNDAHSDWAQFLMESGLLGAAFVAMAAREAVPRFRRAAAAEGPRRRWPVVGAAAGCLAVCVHGLFETNLHVPANALLFAATLSLAYAAAVRDDP
jgi:O-antigen ligase